MHGAPLPWCPRCGGVLSAPMSTSPWVTQWVATAPPRVRGAVAPAGLGPTPRYGSTPRWGLPVVAWRHPLDRVERVSAAERARLSAAAVRPVLIGAAVMFLVAAAAQGWRYSLLLAGRTQLLAARTVGYSDAAVVAAGVVAPVLALVAAVIGTVWLVRARRAAAERGGARETRSVRAVVAGVFVPGWNLGQAGVLVTELQAMLTGVRRPTAQVRWWWVSWVVGVVLGVTTWGWRQLGTAQAQADAVLIAGLADVVAAITAVLTLRLVARCTRELGDVAIPARRWVASVPAA